MSLPPGLVEGLDLRPTWATGPVFFLIVAARYFAVSGAFHWWCTKKLGQWRRIEPGATPKGQIAREIGWSLVTCAIFAAAGTLLLWMFTEGWVTLSFSLEPREIFSAVFSFSLLMALHETYFYWTHRWLHHPWWYRHVHYVHHESVRPTAWDSFCFHPIEAVIQAAALPLLVLLVPTHIAVLGLFLVVMTVLGVINHTGYELYSRGLATHWVGKWIISATHHFQHHRKNRANFGLYFTAWDRWLGTEERSYADLYRSLWSRAPASPSRGFGKPLEQE